jgi:hypothetical protein
MVLPGNHERDCHSPDCLQNNQYKEALQNFTAYNTRFRMPAPESRTCLTDTLLPTSMCLLGWGHRGCDCVCAKGVYWSPACRGA